MHDILFRVKDDISKDFVYGSLSLARDCRVPKMLCNIKPCIVWVEEGLLHSSFVIPETVGQYTGLKDKNGTKIFEGDVVKELSDFNSIGVIEYDDTDAKFIKKEKCYNENHPLYEHFVYEVIGNIHDNPELLKGE